MGIAIGARATVPAAGVHDDVANAAQAPENSVIPSIGPQGRGNLLIAWDPVAQKERWRGLAGGFNQGGTLAAGDLVFSSVNNRLIAYRADNGDQLLDVDTHLSQMSAAMTFMIDGKQYIAVSGGPSGVVSGFGNDSTAIPAGAPKQSRLLVYALDGKAALPTPPTSTASGN
jgi:quinohemoprotein ethanol dehydrogenase